MAVTFFMFGVIVGGIVALALMCLVAVGSADNKNDKGDN